MNRLLFLLFFVPFTVCFAQEKLDSARLFLLVKPGFPSERQLLLADSLLIATVDYYNHHSQNRVYRAVPLTDKEYALLMEADEHLQIRREYYNEKGNFEQKRFNRLSEVAQLKVKEELSQYDHYKAISDSLLALGATPGHDSVISSWSGNDWIDIYDYYRRYDCYVSPQGDTVVKVDAFCTAIIEYFERFAGKGAWKRRVITVHDGGSCVFSVEINLTGRRVRRFRVNGIA